MPARGAGARQGCESTRCGDPWLPSLRAAGIKRGEPDSGFWWVAFDEGPTARSIPAWGNAPGNRIKEIPANLMALGVAQGYLGLPRWGAQEEANGAPHDCPRQIRRRLGFVRSDSPRAGRSLVTRVTHADPLPQTHHINVDSPQPLQRSPQRTALGLPLHRAVRKRTALFENAALRRRPNTPRPVPGRLRCHRLRRNKCRRHNWRLHRLGINRGC